MTIIIEKIFKIEARTEEGDYMYVITDSLSRLAMYSNELVRKYQIKIYCGNAEISLATFNKMLADAKSRV